jgi:molybdenum cofactor biosynthesis protein B
MLSRALAGTAQRRIIVCVPGSLNAVKLAITKLVIPEIGHLVREAAR